MSGYVGGHDYGIKSATLRYLSGVGWGGTCCLLFQVCDFGDESRDQWSFPHSFLAIGLVEE